MFTNVQNLHIAVGVLCEICVFLKIRSGWNYNEHSNLSNNLGSGKGDESPPSERQGEKYFNLDYLEVQSMCCNNFNSAEYHYVIFSQRFLPKKTKTRRHKLSMYQVFLEEKLTLHKRVSCL